MRVLELHQKENFLLNSVCLRKKPVVAFICQCSIAIGALVLAANVASAQNKALRLDGSGSYVELPPNIFKDLTQATVEVWAKFDSFRTYSRIFEFGAGWQSMSLFNHANTSDLRFNLYPQFAKNDPSLLYQIRTTGLLRSSEWIHLAAVSGSRGMKLYANGVLVGQHTNGASFADIKVFQTNYIGRGLTRNPGDQDFRGEIDELRVWNHRRNTAQIRENMFKRLTGKEEGLTHLWNFDDGTASDSSASAHGKLVGNARIVGADIGSSELVASPPDQPVHPSTNAPPPMSAAVNVPPSNSGTAVWLIAGALSLIVALLAWLAVMLRRSGFGSSKLLASPSAPALLPGSGAVPANVAPSSAPQELKERALAELTDFAKQSLVQGLYSQRAALLEAHQKAQQELAEIEARVVALHLPDRIRAYEKRIAELEKDLETRSDELRELTQATLQVLRQKLEEEKQNEAKAGRFN
jgi:hypothetical protein